MLWFYGNVGETGGHVGTFGGLEEKDNEKEKEKEKEK